MHFNGDLITGFERILTPTPTEHDARAVHLDSITLTFEFSRRDIDPQLGMWISPHEFFNGPIKRDLSILIVGNARSMMRECRNGYYGCAHDHERQDKQSPSRRPLSHIDYLQKLREL